MSAPSASWESTLERVKELPTLNNVCTILRYVGKYNIRVLENRRNERAVDS